MLDDAAAQGLAETIASRRAVSRAGRPPPAAVPTSARSWSYFPPKRRQPTPDRARSIARRRTLAASSPMPPALAARFTTGELAALRIVAEEMKARRACMRSLAEIAARAGIGLSTARNAIRTAARLGLVTVEERRVHGARNLPNVVRIVGREWLDWIARGGFKKTNPTESSYLNLTQKVGWNGSSRQKERTEAFGLGSLAMEMKAFGRPEPSR